MRQLFICGIVLLALTAVASAATLEGVLMDKMCSAKALTGGQAAAKAHDRECAIAPSCEKSGYGVYTSDSKFVTLDAAGNTKAAAALKASKKKDDLRVRVTGDVQGDTIKVTKLELL